MTGQGGTGEDLTLLKVNLTPRATAALHAAARMTDDTNTDVVNIAVMLYAQIVEAGIESYSGGTVLREWPSFDMDETLRIAVRTTRKWWQRW